jgi:pyroglutamyl-peptidase
MVGINLRHARIADNAGNQPQDEPVAADGPAAYFATVPVRQMTQAMENAGIAAAVSYSAGTFVCNDTLYALLHHYSETPVRAGFVHVPFLPQQAKEGVPFMELEDIVRGLTVMIKAME